MPINNESEELNMINSLDLLVAVFLEVIALSLLALCLMFLIRKPIVRKVCFYIVVALGLFVAYGGARIGSVIFPMQTAMAVASGAACVAALVLERLYKNDGKKFLIARILASAALLLGIFNTFVW